MVWPWRHCRKSTGTTTGKGVRSRPDSPAKCTRLLPLKNPKPGAGLPSHDHLDCVTGDTCTELRADVRPVTVVSTLHGQPCSHNWSASGCPFSMPATCHSTIRLRDLRESCERPKAKKQPSLKMRSKKKSVKARTCAKTETTTQEIKAPEQESARSQEAPKSYGKGDTKHQAGHAALQAVPSRGLPDATQDITPRLTEPSSGQANSSIHQEAASNGSSQQQTSADFPTSASATPVMPPQQGDMHLAASGDRATAASDKHQCSAAPQGGVTMAQPMPAGTAAAGGGLKPTTSSPQQAAAIVAADNVPPQQTPSASAAEPPGTCALHVSLTCLSGLLTPAQLSLSVASMMLDSRFIPALPRMSTEVMG